MASPLDHDVVTDCNPEESHSDTEDGYVQPQKVYPSEIGVVPRTLKPKTQTLNVNSHKNVQSFHGLACAQNSESTSNMRAIDSIRDDMIEDGSHVVFDWDNTLKLYNPNTGQLSSRVSRQFLLHLKRDRRCRLYIISAIRPSKLNMNTILHEVEKLGLLDVFTDDALDQVDGTAADQIVLKPNEYACKGNIIICGYDKAETFLKLSSFDSRQGDRVVFFDDESVNIDNFSAMVPNSACYLCK